MTTAINTLWHIEQELQALMDTVDACPDELKPEIQADIDRYIGQEMAKVDSIAHVLAALDYEQRCASDEIARLQERKRQAAKAQERLEQYVIRVMSARGVKQLRGKTNTLGTRSSEAVKITDVGALPPDVLVARVRMSLFDFQNLVRVLSMNGDTLGFAKWLSPESVEPSKSAIKELLKDGIEVPGADMEYRVNLTRK